MGGLSRQSKTAGAAAGDPKSAGAGLSAMLEPMLDRDRDGSMIDDVVGMVGGFLGSRRKG